MYTVRNMVPLFYGFKGGQKTAVRATDLLANNRFACKDEQTLKGAFASEVVIKTLALFLFDTQNSLGRRPETSAYFEKLSGVTVCYIVWTIRVALLGHTGGAEKRPRSDSCDGQQSDLYSLTLNRYTG